MFKSHQFNSSTFSYKNLPVFLILFSFVLALLFLLIYYSDQFSTFKQSIILLILIGYVYIICRNADNIFSANSPKTFNLSEINSDSSFYSHNKRHDRRVIQFENELRNITSQMETMDRENQNYTQTKSIHNTFYKSKRTEESLVGRFSLNSLNQYSYSESEIDNTSIIQEIRKRIQSKNSSNSADSYKRLSAPSSFGRYSKKFTKSTLNVFNAIGLSQDKYDICMEVIQDYLFGSMDIVLNRYESYYGELVKMIRNCFGLRLTLGPQQYRQERSSVSLSQLEVFIQTVKRQKCLPKFYKCLVKVQELASYITSIQKVYNRLPNLKVPDSHLALQVYAQILKIQFFSHPIKFVEDKMSVFLYESNNNCNYFVRYKDGTMGYTKFMDFRTKQAKQIVLLYMLNIVKTEHRSQKSVIKQLQKFANLAKDKQKSSAKK